jgi:hypothetical protein
MPAPPRPNTIADYIEWASATLEVDFSAAATRNQYETNVQSAQNTVQNSGFIRNFRAFITKLEEEYHARTGAQLLLLNGELTVLRKPFDSAVQKSFRHNVLRNRDFPNRPRKGWITPDNWYSKLDDLVRSTLVCKFIDAPKILAEALTNHAISDGCTGRHIHRSTDQGYYAFHHYTAFQVEVVDNEWNSQTTNMEFEIQLTTQLQEVLRELTHPLYETARLTAGPPDDQWKWDYDTPRFQTSYLGHTLHLIEAMIVQVRDTGKTPQAEPQQTTPIQATAERPDPAMNAVPTTIVDLAEPVVAPERNTEEEGNVPIDPENQQ